jgi:hypothetical protein
LQTFLKILVVAVGAVASVHANPKAIGTAVLNETPSVQPGQEQDVPGAGKIQTIRQDLIESVRTFHQDGVNVLIVRISAASMNAARLYLNNVSLDSTSKLYIYGLNNGSQPANISGPFEGAGPVQTGAFWTGAIAGSDIVLELQVTGPIPPVLPFDIVGIASPRPCR